MTSIPESTSVLVIGGGPAGSTVAGLLAKEGTHVVVLEREQFPRYHIGESLLPSSLPVLELLGAREKVEKFGFQVKRGVFFHWGPDDWSLSFNELGDETPYAWQVVRSEFDELLLDHAAELGARVTQGVAVREIEFDDGGRAVAAKWVRTTDPEESGRISFDFVVDASGRGGVFANRYLKNRRYNDMFKNVAAWRYWQGAETIPNDLEGSTGVCSLPDGWIWVIPLHDGTVSIGFVTNRDHFNERRGELGGIEAVYDDALARSETVQALLSDATPVSEVRTEQDYSYSAETFVGPGYLLCGDAAAFLDPLLSTGVHLATYSGMTAAAALSSILRGDLPEQEVMDFYQRLYRRAYERMVLLVSAFYESYKGKDYHFHHAQGLSAREKDELNLHDTFLRIISGVEDLEDAKQDAYDLVVADLVGQRGGESNPFNNFKRMRDEPVSPERAIGGLYLTFAPKLGIARA